MKVVTAKQAWDLLEQDAASVLVDVRTPQEWAVVGLPDKTAMSATLVCLSWYPDQQQAFVAALCDAVPDQSTPLLFLCRSGVRSHHASLLAENAGYADVANIVDGFEEQHGPGRGWRAGGLPSAYRPLSGS